MSLGKFIFVILLLSSASSLAGDSDKNTCYTGNVSVNKGSVISVGVYVNNIDTVAGMQVPIYFKSNSVKLICDSVSFAGSRCSDFRIKDSEIDTAGRTAYFALIGTADRVLPPGDGLVATLWFSCPPETAGGRVELYSGPNAYLSDDYIDFNYLFWLPSSRQIEFEYKAGHITVK